MAGLKVAREKGRVGGRKPGLSKDNKIKALAAYNLHEKGEHKVSDILKLLNISKASYYRYIRICQRGT